RCARKSTTSASTIQAAPSIARVSRSALSSISNRSDRTATKHMDSSGRVGFLGPSSVSTPSALPFLQSALIFWPHTNVVWPHSATTRTLHPGKPSPPRGCVISKQAPSDRFLPRNKASPPLLSAHPAPPQKSLAPS